jgi:hypothetical protein
VRQISTRLIGAGLVTPLGDQPDKILAAVQMGRAAETSLLATTNGKREFPVRRVPGNLCADVIRLPRLRRASPISHFAAAAALRCLRDAGLEKESLAGSETALVFAASDGSVEYTRRFFEGIQNSGPGQGSPLLFPETVYNAPASHVAATLGLTGQTLSLVGDSAAGLEACYVAGQLLESGAARRVLVLAAEELDAIAVAGYAAWGLAEEKNKEEGIIFAEGAAALLLEKADGCGGNGWTLSSGPGKSFVHGRQAGRRLGELLLSLPAGVREGAALAVSSHAGRGPARLEECLLRRLGQAPQILEPRRFLGDGLCAASLWQIILAREFLREQKAKNTRALCPVTGHNGQVAVATLAG